MRHRSLGVCFRLTLCAVTGVYGLIATSDLRAQATSTARRTSASASTARGLATDTTFAVARDGIVDITLLRGKLIVRGTDRSDAQLSSNGARYRLQSSRVSASLEFEVAVGRGDGRHNARAGDEPEVRLDVPRATRLVIHGSSADVNVSDVSGDVEVHLLGGDMQLDRLGGRAILETLSGDITITHGVGDLRAETASGSITAQRVRGSIDIVTTSGSVDVDAQRASHVTIDGVSSDIRVSSAIPENARWAVTTHSGDVDLYVSDGSGVMELDTFNGEVHTGSMTLLPNGANATARTPRAPRRFQFGSGGSSRVTVSTFSGDVSVHRAPRSHDDRSY